MPRKKREGEWRTLYAELPADLLDYLDARAARNNRTKTGELSQILSNLQEEDKEEPKKGKKK
jgi:hypothetical protein